MYPVCLEGSRIIAREWEPGDLDAMMAYASDPEAMRWIGTGRVYSRAQESEYLEQVLASATAPIRHLYSLAIVESDTGLVVGAVRIEVRSPDSSRGDIGYVVRRDRWGRGYATEAAELVVRFGFEQLGLHRIDACCDAANLASSRVLEKAGMHLEDRLRDHRRAGDGWRDSLLYAVLRTQRRATVSSAAPRAADRRAGSPGVASGG